jgi:serine/threonine protein kinase
MSAEGYLVAGRYRLGPRIGSGAMGIVWQALDERLGRTVAVKQLLLQNGLTAEESEEAKQRTMREGRIAARLHHQNAVAIYDVVDDAGSPCLVMEYLPSRSLDDVLHEQGALPPHEVARIGAGVAHALAAAHSAGIVHRDIKPANVLLGDQGLVKITDFGISRATDDVTVTKTGLIAGTPAYLAPEVAVGREPKPSSDVFSLGSTLYAAVEGVPPFGLSDNTLGLLHAVAAARVNPPQQAGPLTDVLLSLLRADPEDRPEAREAARMLDAVAHGENPNVPVGAAALAAAPTAITDGPTRAMGPPPAGPRRTATALQPTTDEAPLPYRRKSKRGWWIALLVLAVVAALVTLLFATNLLGGSGNNPQVPVPASSQPSSTTSSSEPTETSEYTPPPVETPTRKFTPQPTETTQPTKTTTTTPTETSEPTDTPELPDLPDLPGGGNGGGGGPGNGGSGSGPGEGGNQVNGPTN